MAKAAQMGTPETGPRRQTPRGITPAESTITIAAALEMLILVGGLLWATNTPPGVALWPRILLVAGIAVLAAIIAIFACAPALRAAAAKDEESASPPDS